MSDPWDQQPILTSPSIGGAPPRLRLEPLTTDHAEAFLAAAADHAEEVFAQLSYAPPTDLTAAQAIIERLNRSADQQPYAQIIADTGEFAGTTSYYEMNPALRALAIGYTWIAHHWWRTWLNTTSKLTLLDNAFDRLGAERIVWHTDIRNIRSQQAIQRLGAQQEGVLRHHRIRRDGSWRDTVQFSMLAEDWPAARDRLTARLAARAAERSPGPDSTGGATMITDPELIFSNDRQHDRYLARHGEVTVGLIDYQLRDDARHSRARVVFTHTETDPSYRGQGIAGRLTRYALDDVAAAGLLLVPLCSYTQHYLTEHPEYADLLAES